MTQMKECPYCKEAIKAEAVKCRFCGEFLEVPKAGVGRSESESTTYPVSQTKESGEATTSFEATEELKAIHLSKICMLGAFLKWNVINLVFGGIGLGLYLNRERIFFIPEEHRVLTVFGVTGVVLAVALIVFLYRYFQFRARVYKVGIDRIECRSGLFSRTVINIETWRVNDVRLEQPFFQRIFGAGMVFIESTDPNEPHLEIGPIGDADENFQTIRRFAREADKRRGVVHLDQ